MADIDATLKEITADIRTIVRGEIELAKAEVVPGAKKAGLGVGLLLGAGLFALIAVAVVFWSLGFAFTNLFWGLGPVTAFALGFLCAAGVYLLIAVVLGVIGVLNVKKIRAPKAALAENERTTSAIAGAIDSGLADVKVLSTAGKKKITTDRTGQIVTVYADGRSLPERR